MQVSLTHIILIYLGAINIITDIDLIGKVLKELAKKKDVALHFIGSGEGLEELKDLTESAGAEFINHGIVYDEHEKSVIMGDADAALNIMKEEVYIGATMKSLDYFSLGIPVINSVQGDTAKLMDEYGAGISIDKKNYKEKINELLSKSDAEISEMRKASRKLFLDNFEEEKITAELADFFDEILD
jgi:glycosyltransferase involved in cell wall biosynthesis